MAVYKLNKNNLLSSKWSLRNWRGHSSRTSNSSLWQTCNWLNRWWWCCTHFNKSNKQYTDYQQQIILEIHILKIQLTYHTPLVQQETSQSW